jgi:hypothetical protein
LTTSIQRTIRFDRKHYSAIDKLAKEQSRTFADVLRHAIDHYLGAQSVLTASQRRQARVVEYAQIALDAIIQEQHPEYRERILAETDRRMERYHGA